MTRIVAALAFVAAVLAAMVSPAAAQEADGQVTLVAQTPWLGDGGSFDLLLDAEDAAGLDLEVTVHNRLSSRSAFVQSLDGRPGRTTRRFEVGVGELPSQNGSLLVSLPLPDAPNAGTGIADLPELREGVYPVSVAILDGRETIDRFVTHLVRLPGDPALTPLAVAWVQHVGAPPALGPGGTLADADRDDLAVLLGALGDSQLELTLAVTPETVDALDPADLEPLARAVAGGDHLLATPYVDIDPVALLAAGLGNDLPVQRQVGEEALFSAFGTRGDPRTWSAQRGLSVAAVARLRSLGVTQLVVPEASLEPLDDDVRGSTTLARPFELSAGGDDVVRAAAVDTGLAGHFDDGDEQVLAAHHLLADLAVLFFDLPGTTRGVVVRPPAGWVPTAAFLDVVFRALDDAPMLRVTDLQGLFEGVEPLEVDESPVVRRPVAPDRSDALPAGRFTAAHRALVELGALAGVADERVTTARRQLLVAEGVRVRDEQRDALLTSVLHARDEVQRRVRLPERRSFRLTAREGTIPLTLVNDNPFSVDIDLVLSSDKLEFTDAPSDTRDRQVLRLELEQGTHTLTIPVRARASGAFQVRTALQTVDGQVLQRGQFTVTSSAFSGVGMFLSIGAGLFLLLWWGSHWRTVRRDRRLVEVPQ